MKETSYINGLLYAYQIMLEAFKAKIQRYNIFYDKKNDISNEHNIYLSKENFVSPHREAINLVKKIL